jgi:hypothetical protein
MAPDERLRQRGGPEPEHGPIPVADITLTGRDRETLLENISSIAPTQESARRWIRVLGLQPAALPAWSPQMNAEFWWDEVFQQFDLGRGLAPYRNLITEILRVYPSNRPVGELHQRYLGTGEQPGPDLEPDDDRCHVIVPGSTEDDLSDRVKALHDLGLEPVEVWSTQHQTLYAVNSGDVAAVRRRMRANDLHWMVVAPGQRNYVIRNIYIQVPDGTRYQAVDTPSQETVRNLTADVLASHREANEAPGDEDEEAGNTVVDRIDDDGTRVRVDPDQTVDDAGLTEDSQLRVGTEARAGAVHPQVREDALHRVRRQIVAYAEGHRAMTVRANSANLPTDYEIEFTEPGFGPPPCPGADPVEIDRHRVLIQITPDFPETHPVVFWQSEIFHPNIWPNYDSDPAREQPYARGSVCLGQLQDAWYPAMDFATVCQLIVDIAGYRNYEVFELVTSDDGRIRIKVNYFDKAAASWAWKHRETIAARNDTPAYESGDDDRYRGPRNVIHPVD